MERLCPSCEIWESCSVDGEISEIFHVWDIEEDAFEWNAGVLVSFDYFVILGEIIIVI
jgi:hypothetical protein